MVDVIFIFQQLKTYFANQFPSFTPDPKGSEENWFAPDTTQIEPDIFNFPMSCGLIPLGKKGCAQAKVFIPSTTILK